MEQQTEVLTGCEVVWSVGCLTVSGEIDLANAPVIEQRIRALLGMGNILVDCRAVTFLDVAGFRMLTRVGVAAIAADTIVRLRGSPRVLETLQLCGVREIPGVVLDPDTHDGPGSLR
jgi:anti-anti-sigma factor